MLYIHIYLSLSTCASRLQDYQYFIGTLSYLRLYNDSLEYRLQLTIQVTIDSYLV